MAEAAVGMTTGAVGGRACDPVATAVGVRVIGGKPKCY